MAQHRRNRMQWQKLAEGWPRSGLTQQGYCERHGISVGSLHRWRRIFREEKEAGLSDKIAPPQPTRLVPVKLLGEAVSEARPLTLLLANGICIEIPSGFDTSSLQRLLGILGAAT